MAIDKTTISGKAEPLDLNWEISSNVLCKFMGEYKYLEEIIERKAIIPRYVIEKLDYLSIEDLSKICFPMICFCDIPLTKVTKHTSRYGKFEGR